MNVKELVDYLEAFEYDRPEVLELTKEERTLVCKLLKDKDASN